MVSFFEQEGVRRQETAYNFWQANKQFTGSCYVCAHSGKHIRCDQCKIKAAYEVNLENYKMSCRSPQELELLKLDEVVEP